MNTEARQPCFTKDLLMGPNCLCLLQELLVRHPLALTAGDTLLDLGCGKGLSTLALAKETPAHICGADLWVPAEENAARFSAWGIGGRAAALHCDANALPQQGMTFDALVSLDAYHYFGTEPDFFCRKMLPVLKPGAAVRIAVPGIRDDYAPRAQELLSPWLGAEYPLFQSPAAWRRILGSHPRMQGVDVWEMDCMEAPWQDWFATGHPYAAGDRQFYDALIRPYTCFVGIVLQV